MAQFKVGDRVTWSSQAAGGYTTKVGAVVAVIPSGDDQSALRAAIDKLVKAGTHRSAYGGGWGRDHESYLVEVVVGGPKAKKVLYWPVASLLTFASSAVSA